MGSSDQSFSDRDAGEGLEGIIADYLEKNENGLKPNPAEYLRQFPQHAEELRAFFRNHRWIEEGDGETTDQMIGATVGPYQIEEEIARGGMGVVYRARQSGLDRPVALKLISGGLLAGREERRRFRIEAEAAARLHHPGIIAIHEIGSWQGHEYFSMTLVDGPTLQQQVEDERFDDKESARLVRDVARAVAYAHRAGIVHRDLKPDNILIGEDGRPMVTDFGLAKWHREGTMLTRTGQVLGTPHYMSPEQACGRGDGDALTDVYSLGAILYALLTGRPPHTGKNAAEVLRSVLQDEPPAPKHLRRDVCATLEKLCLKAIRFDPGGRYASADEFADDLDRYLVSEPTLAEGSGLLDRVAREIHRDQHQNYFVDWSRTLVWLGLIVFICHVAMFWIDRAGHPMLFAFWLPRVLMFVAIIALIYHVRGGSLLPRTVAERPIFSIWLGYLATLAALNGMLMYRGLEQTTLFPIAAALSGFGFIAMSGHIWGGAAILGLGFLVVAIISTVFPPVAPLLFGCAWLVNLTILSRHYRKAV